MEAASVQAAVAGLSDFGDTQYRLLLRLPDDRPAVCAFRAVLSHCVSPAGAAGHLCLDLAWGEHVRAENIRPAARLSGGSRAKHWRV
ncbi:hypothetical protein D3C74_379680 [compost metagenome]